MNALRVKKRVPLCYKQHHMTSIFFDVNTSMAGFELIEMIF